MPNWCSTNIVVKNRETDVIENLEKEFENAFECNKIENGFGKMWLGNILSYLGYDEHEVLNGSIRCRGEVSYMELNGNELHISTETAWVPMLQVIMKMVEKYAPDSEVTYQAVEEGCEIHSTNDPNIAGTIYVDIFENLPDELAWLEEANYNYMTKDQFLKEVGESFGWKKTTEEIKDELLYGEYSDLFSFNEWEFDEISVWD